jgi:phospholipid/cholesterol/gamma-HCH transport system substrate-binding protein
MQVTRTTEIWVGAFVALGLVALFFVAMQVSNLGDFKSSRGSYLIKAHFGNVGGLKVRAPVSMAGVTLGRVEKISFDASRYEALVEVRIDPAFKQIPEDTSASILTAGLLGEQYIGLTAGGSDTYLKEGDEIELTQSAVILEQLISRLMFNKAEEGKGESKKASENTPAPAAPLAVKAAVAPVAETASAAQAQEDASKPEAENEVKRKTKGSSVASHKSVRKHVAETHHDAGHKSHAAKKKSH